MSTLEDLAVVSGLEDRFGMAKVRRMIGYGAVGATGIVVDLSIVEGLSLAGVHHLLAVLVAYQFAMTWNFALQRQFVYKASGNVVRQFLRYLFVDVSAFVVRVGAVITFVDLSDPFQALPYVPAPIDPAVPASFVGIVLAFIIGFQGTDTVVFGRER